MGWKIVRTSKRTDGNILEHKKSREHMGIGYTLLFFS